MKCGMVAGAWDSEGRMLLWSCAGVESASAWLSLGAAGETSLVAAWGVPKWFRWLGTSLGSEFASWLDSSDRVYLWITSKKGKRAAADGVLTGERLA